MHGSPCNIASHLPCWEGTLHLAFCMRFCKSSWTKMVQCDTWVTIRGCQKLLSTTLYINGRLWNTSEAMDVSPHSTAFNFQFWEGKLHLPFGMKIESKPRQKCHDLTHKWLWYANRSFSHLRPISKRDYETFQRQWMSLLLVEHPIHCAKRVPKILHFVWNLRANLGRNVTTWPICGWQTRQSWASPI